MSNMYWIMPPLRLYRGVLLWSMVALLTISAQAQTAISLQEKVTAMKRIRQLASEQVQGISNYDQLSASDKIYYENRINYWLNRIWRVSLADTAGVLPDDMLHIYTGWVYVQTSTRAHKTIKNWGISYIPDINLLYLLYLKYYELYLQYDHHVPLPEILMGIMHIETGFRWINGDNYKSIVPCQLHRPTAAWLLQHPDYGPKFQALIYFDAPDEQGEHHFYSKESMVEFLYQFLMHVKHYRRGNEVQAIAHYNGSAADGHYARMVSRSTAAYLAFKHSFRLGGYLPGAYSRKQVLQTINQWHSKLFPADARGNRQLAYKQASAQPARAQVAKAPGLHLSVVPGKQTGQPAHSGWHYIEVEAERSLFSYFRSYMAQAVFYHNKRVALKTGRQPTYSLNDASDFIYLYYEKPANQGGTRHFVRSIKEYKQLAVHYTIKTTFGGGKMYVNPQWPIYYYQPGKKPVCYFESFTGQ